MFSRAVYAPSALSVLKSLTPAVWVRTMATAASARMASSSGKRGLPGGGARAGDGAAATRRHSLGSADAAPRRETLGRAGPERAPAGALRAVVGGGGGGGAGRARRGRLRRARPA